MRRVFVAPKTALEIEVKISSDAQNHRLPSAEGPLRSGVVESTCGRRPSQAAVPKAWLACRFSSNSGPLYTVRRKSRPFPEALRELPQQRVSRQHETPRFFGH